jgi:N-acetyl-gamma-glutamyl-phosphate reductase
MLNLADVVFLCLPDAAAKSAVAMIDNLDTVVIDTLGVHKTNPAWAYGFPELSDEFDEKIKKSRRIVIPGALSIGFIALIRPLINAGILSRDTELTANVITGYSALGANVISEYRNSERNRLLSAPRQYELGQNSAEIAEIVKLCGLERAPIICPFVSGFYSGVEITVPIFRSQLLRSGIEDVKRVYRESYNFPLVYFKENVDDVQFLSAAEKSDKDSMQIELHGNSDRMILVARYDNLGKGASGAAIECLNIKLGCDYTKSLKM